MNIRWSDFAKSQLRGIRKYYKKHANQKIANSIVKGVVRKSLTLKNQPHAGPREPQLRHRSKKYRYLVHTNYKIIYSVNENEGFVNISDVFDTRQNPSKLNRSK